MFLLLTDGVILDLPEAIDEIVKASVLPLSIIIVGVGQEDFTAMEALDSDSELLYSKTLNRRASRDIVQFVPFRTFGNDPVKLATETLKEIPRQFSDYAAVANLNNNSVQRINGPSYFDKKKEEFLSALAQNMPVNERIVSIVNGGIPVDDLNYVAAVSNAPVYVNPLV